MALYRLYRTATQIGSPLIHHHLRRRRRKGRENPERFAERLGCSRLPRPSGTLLWLHAASVGELTSTLALIDLLRREFPALHILVTTGTVTSAQIAADRLPSAVQHQYAPIDTPQAVRRFFSHWQPTVGAFIESEIWPNLLHEARQRHVPMMLLNARISAGSFRAWRRVPPLAQTMFGSFVRVVAQSKIDGDRLNKLGATEVICATSLKYAAAPPPADPIELERVEESVRQRPCWLAANTHANEEKEAAQVHLRLAPRHPGLLTVIAPRHPQRGDDIARTIAEEGLVAVQRSKGEYPTREIDVYIADTIGEMGLWYRICQVGFIGGSLIPHGGQSPLEAAKLGCAIVTGPHTDNFRDIVEEFDTGKALKRVNDTRHLAETVDTLLTDTNARSTQVAKAREIADSKRNVLTATLDAIAPFLGQSQSQSRSSLTMTT